LKPIVVLAYSGGARSNVAIPWLADRHRAEVVTVTLDLGQSGDMNEIRTQALSAGAARAHVIDAREEFARDLVLPSLKAGALSDTRYPMATALTRPLIAKTLVSIAAIEDASQVAHGAIGRDRRRLAQPISTLNPTLKEIACAEEAGFIANAGEAMPANRIDDNLWGRTIGRRGDDGSREADESLFKITRRLDEAPVKPAHVEIEFERGAAVGINGVTMRLGELIESLKTIAGEHGVGRLDRIKVKPDGTRSRAFYESPAAVVLHLRARRALALCLVGIAAAFRYGRFVRLRRSDRSRRVVRSAAHRPRCLRQRHVGADDRHDSGAAAEGRRAGRRKKDSACLSLCGRDVLTPRQIRPRSILACRFRSIAASSKTTSRAAWPGPKR
jgi:argininosuccinate synthase